MRPDGEVAVVVAQLKARKSGKGWVARCPAHDDSSPSLSIGEGVDGRLLLTCHAGCTFDEIRAKLGAAVVDHDGTKKSNSSIGREVCRYDYRDERGTLLYQVARFVNEDGKKTFRPVQPTGTWGLEGVRRVPYRLQQLLAACAAGKTVCVVEGEKDADNLAAVGVVATTVDGGARKEPPEKAAKLPPDFATRFRGAREVVCLPDNDEPGRAFAARVARELHSAGVPVRVLALPGLDLKSDVSDWLGSGGTPAQLAELVKAAPLWSLGNDDGEPRAPTSREASEDEEDAEIDDTPRLDGEALHGVLGDIVQAIGPCSEAHPAGVLFSLIAAIGAVIGGGPHQFLDGARHALNTFVLLVGPTAAGRKGTAVSHAARVLRMLDEDFSRTRVASGLSSGEGLIERLCKPEEKDSDEAPRTPAPHDPRLLALESEFATVLSRKGREGNSLGAVLRQAWDGESLAVLTVRAKNRVAQDPHVSIIGQITAAELRQLHDGADVRNGFLNRFCLVHVARTKVLPFAGRVPDEIMVPLLARLRAGIDFARRVGEIDLDPDGRAEWTGLYGDLAVSDLGDLGARGAPIVRRIAALFALLDQGRTISGVHLRSALACWRYCEASARYVLGERSGLSSLAGRLNAAIRATPVGLSLTELRKATGSNNTTTAKITDAIRELREAGLVVPQREPTSGRPRVVYLDARRVLECTDMGKMGRMGKKPDLISHKPHNSHTSHTETDDLTPQPRQPTESLAKMAERRRYVYEPGSAEEAEFLARLNGSAA